jgi:hypothetical protein
MTTSATLYKGEKQIFVKMVLDAWRTQNSRVDKFLAEVSDEQLAWPAVLGRNSGLYVIGHLTGITDGLLPILGWGERKYSEFEETFVKRPYDPEVKIATAAEVRKAWKRVNEIAEKKFSEVEPDEWFDRHTAVSAEDFAKEPHRNRLNVIVSRTNHQSYHLGQLLFLTKNRED